MARKKVTDDTVGVAEATSTARDTLVHMVRLTKPFTADVHPDEVDNWKKGGWSVN